MGAKTKEVVRQGPFKEFIPEGVRSGDTIFLSGQISVDEEGNVLHPNDLVAQTRVAYDHIKAVLAEFGATMDDIVDETLLMTDMEAAMGNIEALWTARGEAYGGDPDVAQTIVQVAALVFPELEIEIKCVART